MGTEDTDDPFRRPTTDIASEQPSETPVARTPGFLEMALILAGSAFVGGITFFATCLGALIPFVYDLIPESIQRQNDPGLIIPFVLFLICTVISCYFAFRTGRAIYRWFGRLETHSD